MGGEITVTDDLLAPFSEISVSFRGTNPFLAVAVTPDIIKNVMKIPGKDLLETELRWNVLQDVRGFFGRWTGMRQEDKWSRTSLRIVIQGKQSSRDRTGWVIVRLRGNMSTTYKFVNPIQKSFWWFFNYGFYYKQRRQYLEWSKDNIQEMKERYQNVLGIAK